MLKERRDLFDDDEDLVEVWRRFIVGIGDGRRVCLEKIQILAGLVTEKNVKELMGEFLVSQRASSTET